MSTKPSVMARNKNRVQLLKPKPPAQWSIYNEAMRKRYTPKFQRYTPRPISVFTGDWLCHSPTPK